MLYNVNGGKKKGKGRKASREEKGDLQERPTDAAEGKWTFRTLAERAPRNMPHIDGQRGRFRGRPPKLLAKELEQGEIKWTSPTRRP